MIRTIYFISIIGIIGCNSESSKAKVFPVTFLTDSLVNDGGKNFTKIYIIHGYNNNTNLDSIAIDDMCRQDKTKSKKILRYNLKYYKLSKKTNLNYLYKWPKTLDRYSESADKIAQFTWRSYDSDFMTRIDYMNSGKSTNPILINCN